MALCVYSRNTILLRNLCALISTNINNYLCKHEETLLSLDSDALDSFTTQLMQRKSSKWETNRLKQTVRAEPARIKFPTHKAVEIDLKLIDSVMRDALENGNIQLVTNVIKECTKFRVLPEMSLFLQVFSCFSRGGDKNMVLKLIELSKLLDETTLMRYSYFKHYLAEVIWVKGNISEAIILFEEVYSNNMYLRRRIKSMLNTLVSDSIKGRSEAVLFLILNFAHRLGHKYKDFYTLACIWRCCILSEWFTDQSIALDLLENNENLRETVINHIPFIVYLALREHNTELVYRILEALMRCKSKIEYARVVEILFNYRLNQQDLQGCTKIVQWCGLHGITLAMFQQEQYINLCAIPNSKAVTDKQAKANKMPGYYFKF